METKGMKTRKPLRSFRTPVQIFFVILVALIVLNNALEDTGMSIPLIGSASLHAICPFGGVVSIYEFFSDGRFIQKIHASSFILMAAAFVLAIGFGPLICGWVCPFGTVQEWMAKPGRRLFGRKYNTFVPAGIDKPLRYLRYPVLAFVLYKTATTATLMFQNIDPYYALFNFWSPDVTAAAFAILGAVVAASLFVERPWCKYVCPYGAVLGIFNLFRFFGIRREASTCIDCKACDRSCPMNITVSEKRVVRDHQCIGCMKCTSEHACPIAKTVDFSAGRLKAGSAAIAMIVLVAIFGTVGATSAMDLWRTTNGLGTGKSISEPEAGYMPADIRGSYTFGEIESIFSVPAEDLGAAFGVDGITDIKSFKCKDLEAMYSYLGDQGMEVGTDSVRVFVALYTGLPYDLADTAYLPAAAVGMLKEKASLTQEQLQFLETHTVDI